MKENSILVWILSTWQKADAFALSFKDVFITFSEETVCKKAPSHQHHRYLCHPPWFSGANTFRLKFFVFFLYLRAPLRGCFWFSFTWHRQIIVHQGRGIHCVKKVSKYRVFSCPYFPAFEKIQTRKNSVFGYFSRSDENSNSSLSDPSVSRTIRHYLGNCLGQGCDFLV